MLHLLQLALGLVIFFYLYRALLGRTQTGDWGRLGLAALAWAAISLYRSGLLANG